MDFRNRFLCCGYVELHDPPFPKFWSDLLGDLRDEIWRLRDDGVVPPRSEEEAIVQALQVELKEKNAK